MNGPDEIAARFLASARTPQEVDEAMRITMRASEMQDEFGLDFESALQHAVRSAAAEKMNRSTMPKTITRGQLARLISEQRGIPLGAAQLLLARVVAGETKPRNAFTEAAHAIARTRGISLGEAQCQLLRDAARARAPEDNAIRLRERLADPGERFDGETITLSAPRNGDPVWVQIAKPGKFVKGDRPFELNDDVFEQILRNFKSTQNRQVPVDYEHASETEPSDGNIALHGAPAQGWIRDMRITDGNLWGLVHWGERAREQIRAGEYRFFSPAIRFGAKDRHTGKSIGAYLSSGALTNIPFLDGMHPLAARETA